MNVTIEDLTQQVGGFVRLAPGDFGPKQGERRGWIAGRLIRLDGERHAIIVPAGHQREERIPVERIHKWKGVWHDRDKKNEVRSETLWVVADARLPRYASDLDADSFVGNPAEAETFADMSEALRVSQRMGSRGGTYYPLPLDAACERYAATVAPPPAPLDDRLPDVPGLSEIENHPVAKAPTLGEQIDMLRVRFEASEARVEAAKAKVQEAQTELELEIEAHREVETEIANFRSVLNAGLPVAAKPKPQQTREGQALAVLIRKVVLERSTVGETYTMEEMIEWCAAAGADTNNLASNVGRVINSVWGNAHFERVVRGHYKRRDRVGGGA